MRTLSVAALLFAVLGCGGSDAPADDDFCAGSSTFVGDENADPEIEILSIEADDTFSTVSDGGTVMILGRASQGGVSTLLIIGARVLNVDLCEGQMTATLRDLSSDQIRFDSRTVNLPPNKAGNQGESTSASNACNVPVCPNQWSDRDIFGVPYELSLEYVDVDGRTASKAIEVTPVCYSKYKATCECLCQADYQLGQSC